MYLFKVHACCLGQGLNLNIYEDEVIINFKLLSLLCPFENSTRHFLFSILRSACTKSLIALNPLAFWRVTILIIMILLLV